jgi:hypothetical protein
VDILHYRARLDACKFMGMELATLRRPSARWLRL